MTTVTRTAVRINGNYSDRDFRAFLTICPIRSCQIYADKELPWTNNFNDAAG